MEKAYKYTNEASFQTQRKDLIPQVPKTKDAGIYNDKNTADNHFGPRIRRILYV
jgi:hypothetical protein